MSYKEFQDWYREAEIKHLLLLTNKGNLISPPFATDLCKEYSIFYHSKGYHLNLNLPPATSKTSACINVNESIWMLPYNIYDESNIVVEITDGKSKYHHLPFNGKGQFYSVDTDGVTAFSFPLGYEGTNHGIYIKDSVVTAYPLPTKGIKLHMGTVYCNGRYWSMPRGDTPYNFLMSFDGQEYQSFELKDIDQNVTRKYTDIVKKDKTLYSLPYGETKGLNSIVEFNTETHSLNYYDIEGRDFSKKYNSFVLLKNKIIGLPYGGQDELDSNLGIVFDTDTKKSFHFDIGIFHGGKYRYRSGISFKDHAYFFPSGTPSCPILKIDINGVIIEKKYYNDYLMGRPICYQEKLCVILYNITTRNHEICMFDENLEIVSKIKI
jgi:hypothetical protein